MQLFKDVLAPHVGHRYIELFLESRPDSGNDGGGREAGDYAGRGGARGGASAPTRYPGQTSWSDPKVYTYIQMFYSWNVLYV